jgi:F-type H+-transporting ATPase subunit delta
MADDAISNYARGLQLMAVAEGRGRELETEMRQVAAAVNGSDELRSTLADANLPAARRQQIVEDLLKGQVSPVTVAAVSMIVASGRAGDLGRIAERVAGLGAEDRGHVLAEVRSAVPLDADQERRLADALRKATGQEIEVNVVVDPSVMGGLITQIGDQIIDGSVRSRLQQLRAAF